MKITSLNDENNIAILIVDDLADNRKLLRYDLRDELKHTKIDEAANGTEALELLTKNSYMVVICDIMMPGMDGFEVLQRARTIPRSSNTPFLFLSAIRRQDAVKRGLQLGAVDYITKPYNIDELVQKVRTLAQMKLLQDDLMTANKRLQRHNDEKNRMMKVVSHDLRSPLSGIRGLAKILAKPDVASDAETVAEYAEIISSTADSLYRLVSDLLSVANIENSTHLALSCREFSLQSMVESCCDSFHVLAHDKKIRLEIDVSDTHIVADEPKLLQVMNNLLSNAIKFTPEGGKIIIRAHSDDNETHIEVTDTGIGIPQDVVETLFDFTGSHRRVGTNNEESFGLGMPIIKSYVELHGGEISVQSIEGEGTTFTIRIPRQSFHSESLENS